MTSISIRRSLAVAASFAFAAVVTVGAADAADLTYKSPPPPAPEASNIHGFFDVGFAPDYMTHRGVLVTNTGLTTQVSAGLSVDLYKNKAGWINSVTVYGGVWNDLWSEQHDPQVGSLNEYDWWAGGKVGFAQNWMIDAQFISFISPMNPAFPGNRGGFGTRDHVTATLSYDDTSWGLPIQIKPYITGWYQTSGSSDVGSSNTKGSGYVEFGMVPTLNWAKTYGVIFTAPTYVSVGPKDYWANGAPGCGSLTTPCSTSNAGLFSTGLTATVPVTWIPSSYGNWSVRGGFQYYHLINDILLQDQVGLTTASSFATAKRDVVVGFTGVGFTF